MGTMSGGSLTIRGSPSTTWVSLSNAWMLSFVRAFSTRRSASLRPFLSSSAWSRGSPSWICMRAYQTSRLRIDANSRIAVRYSPTEAVITSPRSASENPLFRPATARLAARRFTSHSHGPGRVSSKSLMSNSSSRSGDPNRPKFDTCASPQTWTLIPDRGVEARSAAMR